MARNKDGLRVATCLFEAAAWHYAIRVVCRCGHDATFNPHGLWWHFERKRWDDAFRHVRTRMWCRTCRRISGEKARPVQLALVRESEADIRLAMPPESEWKRAISRFRS